MSSIHVFSGLFLQFLISGRLGFYSFLPFRDSGCTFKLNDQQLFAEHDAGLNEDLEFLMSDTASA